MADVNKRIKTYQFEIPLNDPGWFPLVVMTAGLINLFSILYYSIAFVYTSSNTGHSLKREQVCKGRIF